MNTGQGITALDPTVGLLQKELEVNNVPPGQEAQYFQSKGRPLSPQLVFLIQARTHLQQNAQQVQAPQSTVADDISSDLVQEANQGIAARMPQRNPREQGIARLPAEIGGERAYAGGGIVAFAEGGWTSDDEAALSKAESNLRAAQAEKYALGPYGGVSYADPQLRTVQQELQTAVQKLKERKRIAEEDARLSSLRAQYGAPAPATPPAAPAAPPVVRQAPPAARPNDPVSPGGIVQPPQNPFAPDAAAAQPEEDERTKEARRIVGMSPEALAEDEQKRREGYYAKYGLTGIEAARQAALDARMKALQDEKATDAEQKKKDLMMQLAASAFGSVGKGRTFAQSLGNIGAGFAQGAVGVEKEYRGKEKDRKQMVNSLEDAKLAMQEAKAMRAVGDAMGADKKAEEARKFLYDAGVKDREIKVHEEANRLHAKGLDETAAYHAAQVQLGYADLYENKSLRALAALTGKGPTQMSVKDTGDKLRELESSPEVLAFTKQEIDAKGKSVVNTSEFKRARDKLVAQLFEHYYSRGASNSDFEPPEHIQNILMQYPGKK